MTTATHAGVVSKGAKKITDSVLEIGEQGLQTVQTEGGVKTVDNVLHVLRFIYPNPDFPDQSQDLAPFPPERGEGC